MRAGWGVVVLKEGECKISWKMHGACPEVYPSVLRAELAAVLNVLRVAVPPIRIHVDNAEVVSGFRLGREWCTEAGRDGGEIWREVWARMEDMDGQVEVLKVKAHTQEADVDEGVVTARDRFGNLHADAEARCGARLAESLSPVGIPRAELVKALRWLGWARRFAAVWRPDAREEQEEAGGGGGGKGERGWPGPRRKTGLRHILWVKGPLYTCRRCGRVADTEQKRRDLHSSRCLGSAAGRLISRTCNDPEAVSRSCMERREDLAKRGWRALEGGGDEMGMDSLGPAGDFEEELEGRLSSEEDPVEDIAGERGSGGLGWEEDGGAAAVSASAAASGSASAIAEGGSARQAATVGHSSSEDEPSGRPQRHQRPRVGAGPLAIASERRPTTKPWKRDPDWLYPSYIGVAAREAAAAVTAARPPATAEADEPALGEGELRDWPELPAAEARAVLAQWGMRSHGPSGGEEPRGPQDEGRERALSRARKRPRLGHHHHPHSPHHQLEPFGLGPDELSDEDPFGYVAEDLAAQPPLSGLGRVAGDRRRVRQRVLDDEARPQQDDQRRLHGDLHRPELDDPAARDSGFVASADRGARGRADQDTRRRDRDMGVAPMSTEEDSGSAQRPSPRQGSRPMRKRPGVEASEDAGVQRGPERKRARLATGPPGEGGRGAAEAARDAQQQRHGAAVQRRQFGRRYLGVSGDPVDAADARGHVLLVTGPIIWCGRCGRYAFKRLGRALKADCSGDASGVYGSRIARLREGLHPVTGGNLL